MHIANVFLIWSWPECKVYDDVPVLHKFWHIARWSHLPARYFYLILQWCLWCENPIAICSLILTAWFARGLQYLWSLLTHASISNLRKIMRGIQVRGYNTNLYIVSFLYRVIQNKPFHWMKTHQQQKKSLILTRASTSLTMVWYTQRILVKLVIKGNKRQIIKFDML